MILTAHQPAYLPWLGLFHKIALSDIYVFMDDVKYSKSDYSNRNQIKLVDGRKQWLTVPLKTKGSDSILFKELEIDNTQSWQKKHLNIIRQVYGKAPFISELKGLMRFYETEYRLLCDLNLDMLQYFLNILAIKARIVRAKDLNIKTTGNAYLIDLCRHFDGKLYVFGELGRNYAQTEQFENAGIDIYFQQYQHPQYFQINGDFVSHLSIIDLLFNVGAQNARSLVMKGNIDSSGLKKD